MNITRSSIEGLHEKIFVEISNEDYQEKVENTLKDYRKRANIPGFRQGKAPAGLIKKQFGDSILQEEVMKISFDFLNKYLSEQKLALFGSPILSSKINDFDWSNDHFTLEYEICLQPEIDIDLTKENDLIDYEITIKEEVVQEQIEKFRGIFGSIQPIDEVVEECEVVGTFINEELGIKAQETFLTKYLQRQEDKELLKGKKVGEVVTLRSKKLFTEDTNTLNYILDTAEGYKDKDYELETDEDDDVDIMLTLTIEQIKERKLAELDEVFFKRVTEDDTIKSVEGLRDFYKQQLTSDTQETADQRLFNQFNKLLLDKTSFELPEGFVKKWLNVLTKNDSGKEYDESNFENDLQAIRNELLMGGVAKKYNIKLSEQDLTNASLRYARMFYANFGIPSISDRVLREVAENLLKSKDNKATIEHLAFSAKFLETIRKEATLKVEEIDEKSYKEMIESEKSSYQENQVTVESAEPEAEVTGK